MPSSKQGPQRAGSSKPALERDKALKFGVQVTQNPREELWWSRRLASGSDWFDEWTQRPTRR